MNMLMAADPLIHRNTRNIRAATIRMSRQSAADRLRKPKIDNIWFIITLILYREDNDFSLIMRS